METDNEPTVGARVKVRTRNDDKSGADSSGSDVYETGAIVDDFGVQATDSTSRDWAVAKRWAVALDSGRLVFVDTDDLTLA